MATATNPEPAVLPSRPYLKPWFRIAREDERMVLYYGHEAIVLEGKAVDRLLPVLIPLLDGTRTLEEIDDYVGERAQPAVRRAIEMLQERRLLTDGPPASNGTPDASVGTAQLIAAVSADDRRPSDVADLLANASASIVGCGAASREIARVLGASGIGQLRIDEWPTSEADVEPADLVLVAPAPHELPLVQEWNRLAFAARIPWLQVLPFDGGIGAVGPVFLPGETCCHECYRRRRGANLNLGDENFWALEKTPAAYPAAPAVDQIAVGLATTLALQWLGDPPADDSVSTLPAILHAIEWGPPIAVTQHHVYRVPRCPVCFGDDLGSPSPWHG
jgi:bacteriocin biosynthesis cyclodehydratase domain-containing protein